MSQNDYGLQENERFSFSNKKAWMYAYFAFLGINSLFAMSVATQSIASAYNYQEALGNPWFLALNRAWYAPWNVFLWADSISKEVLNSATNSAQLYFIAPQFIFFGILIFNFLPKGNKKLHGSAHFASEQEIKDMGYLGGVGVYVGGCLNKRKEHLYLRHNGPEHIMCFAPTRSGKGVGLILPTLLAWEGSSIILDIKGENWALTSGWRKSQGQKVLRFDPSDASGSSCKFNPLEEIRMDTLYAIQDVQNMAMMMVDPDGKGLADHWTKAAFSFFSGLILHCLIMVKANKERSATLYDLTLMMSDRTRTTEELLDEMLEGEQGELLKKFAPHCKPEVSLAIVNFITSSASEMKSKDEKEASGVLSSALVNMALYRDPIVNINTEQSDFRITDLMNDENPVNLYLVLSPADIDRVRPLMRLIMDLIIRRICKDMAFKDGSSVAGYKHRILVLLDEFTSLGKLPIIEKSVAFFAGYGGIFYFIVQDITQLNGVYGKDNALMANCHIRIAYAPNTIETAKILSEMTGKTTVVDKKVSISSSKGGRSKSTSISETARALLTPDECMRLPGAVKNSQGLVTQPGHMLIFTAGQSPIYGRQILYFKDPIFSQRAKIEAPGISEMYPSGITDSLYYPRPEEWYGKSAPSELKEVVKIETVEKTEKSFDDFFKE